MAKLIYEGKAKQMWSTDDPEVYAWFTWIRQQR